MPDALRSGTQPALSPSPSLASALESVPDEQRAAIRRLIDERDLLFVLHEALIEVERTSGLENRLRLFIEAIRKTGFGRVAITLRDAALEPTLLVTAGLTKDEERTLQAWSASGDVWRRRLAGLERFRISQSFYLDAHDEWVMREFRGALPSHATAGPAANGALRDALLVPLHGARGQIVATMVLDDLADGSRPTIERVRIVELFAQQMAYLIGHAALVDLSQRRAERLQRLQEVGGVLTRSLDEREIVLELARQISRTLLADGVVVAEPDLDQGTVVTKLRLVRGVERPRPPRRLGHGVVAEAARTGRPVRFTDYDGERYALAAADDLVGDGGPAGSVLAVPMMIGANLVGVLAVYAGNRGEYTADDEELLLAIAALAAAALANARLYANSQQEQRQSEALADLARAVSESLRPDDVLQLSLRHAATLLRAEGACVALHCGDALEIDAVYGSAEPLHGLRLPIEGSMSGRAVRSGAPVIANEVAGDPEMFAPAQRAANVNRALIVPLLTSSGPIGSLSVINRDEDFGEKDLRILLRLADHVAVAITKARLFESLAEATREWAVAFDAIASGMVLLDRDGRIVRCNARAVQLADATDAEALVGQTFHEAILDEETPCEDCVHKHTLALGVVGRGTHRSPTLGKVFELVASPHPNGGAVVAFDDVTGHHALAERHRRVVETTSDAIVITDLQRRIAFANPAALELFGRRELTGALVRDLVAPESAEEIAEHETRGFAGEPQRYEVVLVRQDGERRIVSVSTVPLREIGQITGIVASLRDVTTERRARDAVSQSEARYRNLFETASDAIYTLDPHGAFTSANQTTCEMTGLEREALLGRSVEPLLDSSEVASVREHFAAALAGHARRYECHFLRRGGERRLASVTNTPIRVGKAVIGVLGVARDVTEERRRAEALERSEDRYSRLVESASDAIFTVDADGRFTSVNRALEHAIGLPRARLLGAPFLQVVDARDRETTWRIFQETLAGERRRVQFRFHSVESETRTGSIISSPIMENGRVMGALGIVRDVTEERRLTEQLLQQEKLAAVGQLVSGVAHELNNPLAGVMAFSQILLATAPLAAEQEKAAQTIHLEAKRATKIVSNLLTFARQHQPERTTTDLNQVLLETLELRRYTIRVQQIEIELALDPELPVTWGDPFQLQQVFLNLIANAEQALTGWAGTKRLMLGTARAGDRLLVTVADTGGGIAPEDVNRIFNPFFTTKGVGKGTGLGLSISDGIVREHGGSIRVETRPGAGATFIIDLPYVPVPATAAPRVVPDTPQPPARGGGSKAVLVIDDEPSVRDALCAYLISIGHEAEGVASGSEALTRVAARRFDAVLLDLRMPDMSGDEVFAALQRQAPELAARTVFVTGDTQSEEASAFIRSTGRPCISKPFILDDVANLLFAEREN
jgi:PAS domain S-box-containing protein